MTMPLTYPRDQKQCQPRVVDQLGRDVVFGCPGRLTHGEVDQQNVSIPSGIIGDGRAATINSPATLICAAHCRTRVARGAISCLP
jgi:hypothetical protein